MNLNCYSLILYRKYVQQISYALAVKKNKTLYDTAFMTFFKLIIMK